MIIQKILLSLIDRTIFQGANPDLESSRSVWIKFWENLRYGPSPVEIAYNGIWAQSGLAAISDNWFYRNL